MNRKIENRGISEPNAIAGTDRGPRIRRSSDVPLVVTEMTIPDIVFDVTVLSRYRRAVDLVDLSVLLS